MVPVLIERESSHEFENKTVCDSERESYPNSWVLARIQSAQMVKLRRDIVPMTTPQALSSAEALRIEQLNEQDLQSLAVACCETYIRTCAEHFGINAPHADILFNLRGRSAGQLRFNKTGRQRDFCLRFNGSLLDQNRSDFFNEVIPHEVAHLFAYIVYGTKIKPHGKEWRDIMATVFGLAGRVTHNFDVPPQTRKLFNYACGCEGKAHELTAIRHNRVRQNKANYRCRVCAEVLYEIEAGA